MPLLGIFSKKSNYRSKSSGTASDVRQSISNLSLDDEDYVSVVSPNQRTPASSSKLALSHRAQSEQAKGPEQQSPGSFLDPLLLPPPRGSSLFHTHQDELSVLRSTQSLPDGADHRKSRPRERLQQTRRNDSTSSTTTLTKKFMFSWGANKLRSASAPSVKEPGEDTSFNLKSFRHVRPDSPSPALPPISIPTPTSGMPYSPVSFQVISRRPRGTSVSDLNSSVPQQTTFPQPMPSQQKISAGVFRQAARRSATSLNLTDSPTVSPTRSSLDDRPPPSLLPPQPMPGTPTRPPRSQVPQKISQQVSRAPVTKNAPRRSTNAFSLSSSSSSSSEEEKDDDLDSIDDGAELSREPTIKPRVAELNSPKAPVREQTRPVTPTTGPVPPRAQSSLGVYGPGLRSRASQSVGALSPSAKEARASVAIAENARPMTSPRLPPKSAPTHSSANAPGARRAAGGDTSSDSDEDMPLSSLVPPRRPTTSLSSYSGHGTPHKPLVDLNAPSSLTGRPIRAPPPMQREVNTRHRTSSSLDLSPRNGIQDSPQRSSDVSTQSTKVPQTQSPQWLRSSQVSLQQDAKVSPASRNPRQPQVIPQQASRPSQGRAPLTHPPSRTIQPSSVTPPLRPFARRESPASSTGDSSSGKAPLTPLDGSDLGGGSRSAYSESASRSRHGHGRRPSVTFEDESEPITKAKSRERDNIVPQEARLRERRRTEARAAIELGNVVNGPPPVDEDDPAPEEYPNGQMGWGQAAMQMPVPPMFNMGMNLQVSPAPGAFGFTPPPGMDAAYLAAHQQAMAIAKQTFQYAVAQQALAAADEEWERSSNAGVHWGGSQWGGGSAYGGLGAGMRSSAMFPPAPRSMYAGSGGGGGSSAAWGGWGGGSVYGETFGPARHSIYSQANSSATLSVPQRTTRPRTKTAPSASTPPVGAGLGRMPAPPSSFRGLGH